VPVDSRTLRLVADSPLRSHARIAVSADTERAVLLTRVAQFLRVEQPTSNANTAAAVLRLVDEIRAERPPTPFEIACVEHERALQLARSRVRCHAVANGHDLAGWSADPERDGCELACCTRCRAGASIHLGTARESLSDDLLRSCPTPGGRS